MQLWNFIVHKDRMPGLLTNLPKPAFNLKGYTGSKLEKFLDFASKQLEKPEINEQELADLNNRLTTRKSFAFACLQRSRLISV